MRYPNTWIKYIMKKYTWRLLVSLWLLLLLTQNAVANCGAGTVLYFTFKADTYLLIADHQYSGQRHRGWSGFGGLCDGEPSDVAAARETEEETKGFYKRGELLTRIGMSPKIRVGNFTTFFVEVDYVPAVVFNNLKPPGNASGYLERGPYAWVPFPVIRQAIENRQSGRALIAGKYLPPDARTNWLFEPFLTSLKEAETAGILPWNP
jgi:8-oxo-dGTP pyrophosphatase MutT (NUDIX family)